MAQIPFAAAVAVAIAIAVVDLDRISGDCYFASIARATVWFLPHEQHECCLVSSLVGCY